jgi:hypothetical protein
MQEIPRKSLSNPSPKNPIEKTNFKKNLRRKNNSEGQPMTPISRSKGFP